MGARQSWLRDDISIGIIDLSENRIQSRCIGRYQAASIRDHFLPSVHLSGKLDHIAIVIPVAPYLESG